MREAATICPTPASWPLTLVVSESRVTWARLTSVPILVFLCLSVLDTGPMYVTDRRQTRIAQYASSTLWGQGKYITPPVPACRIWVYVNHSWDSLNPVYLSCIIMLRLKKPQAACLFLIWWQREYSDFLAIFLAVPQLPPSCHRNRNSEATTQLEMSYLAQCYNNVTEVRILS